MTREVVSPILLIFILAFWAIDEAKMPSSIGPWPWVRPVIVAILFLGMAHRLWRGRYEA